MVNQACNENRRSRHLSKCLLQATLDDDEYSNGSAAWTSYILLYPWILSVAI